MFVCLLLGCARKAQGVVLELLQEEEIMVYFFLELVVVSLLMWDGSQAVAVAVKCTVLYKAERETRKEEKKKLLG